MAVVVLAFVLVFVFIVLVVVALQKLLMYCCSCCGASVMMVCLLFFFPVLATPLGFMFAAMIGSMVFTLILVSVARRKGLTTTRLLLIGVALGILSSAIVTWAFYFSDDLSLRQLMYWLMGS